MALAALILAACGNGSGNDSPTLLVNSLADTDERDGTLTLREALLVATGQISLADLDDAELAQVDGAAGPQSDDVIRLDEALSAGATIALESSLPVLSSGGDTIDGRPVGGEEAPGLVIDGSAGAFTCLRIDSSRNAVLGVEFTACRTAILLGQQAAENRIGGSGPGEGNVISGNVVGIELRGRMNLIQGNYIGIDRSGEQADGNDFEGIWITPLGKSNTIGGPNPGEGNVISGNPLFGISIDGAFGNVVQGNVIGLNASATVAVGNRYGINIQAGATENIIGGDAPEEANVITGNNTGVLLRDPGTSGNTVRGNRFVVTARGDEVTNAADIFQEASASGNVVEDNELK
ncbi:MAG: right-handed parallel beta-helix repeat-containing protein [Chloroflexi bacterium]|nr:right-handed parallel beta-helix repeat-containing protein [Chloroflexota bacterium]